MHQVQPRSSGEERSAEGRGGDTSIVAEGVLAGITGAVVVALWFLLLDAARGQPFITPSLLGSALFLGRSVDQVTSANALVVFAYTGVHGVLFLMTGVALAWMVAQFERNPQFGLVLVLLFALFQAVLFGLEAGVVPNLVGTVGAAAVAIANLFAAVAMFWFLLRRHPSAMLQLRRAWRE